MIAVVNVSRNYSRTGRQHYEVRLNEITLSRFTHNTEDGMIVCLQLAAESLEGVNIDEKIRDYRLLHTMGVNYKPWGSGSGE